MKIKNYVVLACIFILFSMFQAPTLSNERNENALHPFSYHGVGAPLGRNQSAEFYIRKINPNHTKRSIDDEVHALLFTIIDINAFDNSCTQKILVPVKLRNGKTRPIIAQVEKEHEDSDVLIINGESFLLKECLNNVGRLFIELQGTPANLSEDDLDSLEDYLPENFVLLNPVSKLLIQGVAILDKEGNTLTLSDGIRGKPIGFQNIMFSTPISCTPPC